MISTEDIQGTRQGTDEDLSVVKTEEFEDCFDADDCRVHDGDLEIDGDFDGSNEVLIVKGDLVVTGYRPVSTVSTMGLTGIQENRHSPALHRSNNLCFNDNATHLIYVNLTLGPYGYAARSIHAGNVYAISHATTGVVVFHLFTVSCGC